MNKLDALVPLDEEPVHYEEDHAVYAGDSFKLLDSMAAETADLVLSDIPYGLATVKGARGLQEGSSKKLVRKFEGFTDGQALSALNRMGKVAKRWVVVFCDYRHIPLFENYTPEGLKFVRFGVWVKPNSAPQLSGDRPAQGWEAVAILHKDVPGRMQWNGGGHRAVWTHNVVRGKKNATEKPLPLVEQLVSLFSNPGDIVLDPFCGSGVTGQACKRLGRLSVSIDVRKGQAKIAAGRLKDVVIETEDMVVQPPSTSHSGRDGEVDDNGREPEDMVVQASGEDSTGEVQGDSRGVSDTGLDEGTSDLAEASSSDS